MIEQAGGNGVSGSYMRAFLPGLVIGLVVGGFGGAYLVPMLSSPDATQTTHPGPRPGTVAPTPDPDRIQERPEQPAAGETKPEEAKPGDAKPPEPAPEVKPAEPAPQPAEPAPAAQPKPAEPAPTPEVKPAEPAPAPATEPK